MDISMPIYDGAFGKNQFLPFLIVSIIDKQPYNHRHGFG